MWLINTTTLELEEFLLSKVKPYAILSHTWGQGEISFADLQSGRHEIHERSGYAKIRRCCSLAKEHGLDYAWVDTCCIDKRSSADLSEAINSMYRYYHEAEECFIYLVDIPGRANDSEECVARQLSQVACCKWLTRGWTLQELIAPKRRIFYAEDWTLVGEGRRGERLLNIIQTATGIKRGVLRKRDTLSRFCIAERMSWAARRKTTRSEDMAYSLMGIFNVNMPILYGEGAERSFHRLQLEILKTSFDQTIFAWMGPYDSSGLLAYSPSDFGSITTLGFSPPFAASPSTMTNMGLSVRLPLIKRPENPHAVQDAAGFPLIQIKETKFENLETLKVEGDSSDNDRHVAVPLQCFIPGGSGTWLTIVIQLARVSPRSFHVNGSDAAMYRRIRCHLLGVTSHRFDQSNISSQELLVLEDDQCRLLEQTIRDSKVSDRKWLI